jgi:dihydroflavonol-4-reductase
MKVFVTGANGFLGSYIVRNLLQRGQEVKALVRKTADTNNLKGLDFDCIHGNFTHQQTLRSALKGTEIVIHAAALVSPAATQKELQEVNVHATKDLLQAAIEAGCRKIIYVSTANTIGYGDETSPGNETMAMSAVFRNSAYALSKSAAEQLVLKASRQGLTETVIVNPSFMLGYDAVGNSSARILKMYMKSTLLPVPPGGKNFIHVDDVAKGICNAIDRGQNGERYLLVNKNMTYAGFYDLVQKVSGIKRMRVALPAPVLMAAGYAGTVLNNLGIRLALRHDNMRILNIRNYYTAQKAVEYLQLPQTPIETAIKEALQSYPQHL